jgi:hypothetical protein
MPRRCDERHLESRCAVDVGATGDRAGSGTEEPGTEAAHPFVSVIGAAWLLMGQPGVTETRSIADALQRA